MRLHKFAIIILLIVFLASTILVRNFDFLKNISGNFLGVLSVKSLTKINNYSLSGGGTRKGIYLNIWAARSKRVDDLMKIADETEINAIIVDVKDNGVYIDDYVKNLIEEFHRKNIYAVARIVVFQDNSQTDLHPDWYFTKEDGSLWIDKRGWHWFNPANEETWAYNIKIAKAAIDAGFDELNFDYVRFPVLAENENILFPPRNEIIVKSRIINEFARRLTSELKKYNPNITLSIDLFAYNMLSGGDLGVGQVFTELYDYFDYISPMIYPSHYLPGNFGFDNPAEYPYEVVLKTIESGKRQLYRQSITESGTTTPALVDPIFKSKLKKLRPWLQDFSIGAVYDGEMVRKEKQAVYDADLTSGWFLWNPRGIYTESALNP